ncbi:MAG: glycoside-pentoside-hexuronide (GPH):cation symporter [Lachnospiraceae bacterium]|jgi:GPH family glycoside/pentoside/hexuronide:cation symporter
MQEKNYLKWYNKVGYGSGDIAGNVVYAFLSSFVMIYLTNTVGLNPGIVGSLIAASKVFDGVTDIFFGAMIDKTKTRLGKARPWMLYAYIGCAVTLVAIFAVPVNMGRTSQYAWFFIAYTLLNAVFYTANNIAYSALTALVTKNSKERVQMGSCRFIFAFSTSLLIQSVTVGAVAALGGGASGWRTLAVIYAVIGLAVNTISVLSVKELPDEELNESAECAEKETAAERYGLVEAVKLLAANRFYLMICGVYILQQVYTAMINMGIYYMTYVLKNENLYGVFSWAVNIPLIIALVFTPALVAKWNGMYKLNLRGYMLGTLGRGLVVVAGYMGSVPLMLLFTAVAAFGQGPWQGDMNAVIASCSEYTYLTKHKRVDGTMYSCTSLGIKLGGGLGTAAAGWLLAASGFDGAALVQTQSCMNMLYFMYLWLPMIISLLITIVLSRMNVEQANAELKKLDQ